MRYHRSIPQIEADIEILVGLQDSLPEVEELLEGEAWNVLTGAIYHLSEFR